MTDRTHHHCQCDNCDGEDCKDLPVAPQLKGASPKELIDELCKRGCVTTIIVEDDERTGFCYIVNGNDKATKVWGAATILVVKE